MKKAKCLEIKNQRTRTLFVKILNYNSYSFIPCGVNTFGVIVVFFVAMF